MRFETGGATAEGITVLAQNSDPFTYFGNRPVRVCEGIEIDDGTLSVAVLRRAAQRDMATIIARVLIERLRASGHRQIDHFDDVTEGRVDLGLHRRRGRARVRSRSRSTATSSATTRELELGIDPGALTVVA